MATTTTRIPDLAALGAATGAAIGRHLDSAFRAMVRSEHCVEDSRFLRLLTGEPHPFGNFALLSAPVDVEVTREAVGPLVARGVAAAVLFPGMEPLRLAARLGYRVGILQASEAGHPLYRSLGFADFGGVPLFVRIPA